MNDLYMLTNFIDLSVDVKEPLKQTQRIKYTCFDVSSKYLVLGASSGSIYLYYRKPCKFLHLVPGKHGPVSILSISPNEKYIAFATLKGAICVYVINLSPNSAPHVVTSNIGESAVTCLHWSADERQFYYGNRRGEVHLVSLSFFMGRSLLNISVHPILYLDSAIVQISDFETLLLVSNYTKCILCNTEYEEFKQIGNRPRDGYFGACFAISPDESVYPSRIYCARPGSRLWEVDLEGNVLQTHQFKAALARPPAKISKGVIQIANDNENERCSYMPQTLQFQKLQVILMDYILTHTESGLYIFDPKTSSVVLWCNDFERITDCRVIGDEIIVFTHSCSIVSIRLQAMQSYAVEMVLKKNLLECVHLLKTNLKYFAEKAKEQNDLSVLNEIKSYLIKTNQYEVLNDLSVIFDSITLRENEMSKVRRLENGIYVLENSFCDNLKTRTNTTDRHIKDALLTVTGKFGKNIIKYKFNIFSEDQKNLVNELIPQERTIPFKEINEQFEIDDNIVCRKTSQKKYNTDDLLSGQIVTDEEKTIRNLFIIFKSSKISNFNFLERYSKVFDKYDSREIIDLLSKLEKVMIENGDTETEAKKNCYEMYFNYLKPEIIWEVDDVSREFIINGFILINSSENTINCDSCNFPVCFQNSCQFHSLGEVLIKFLWSRNDQERCFEILRKVPAVMDVICRFYMQENRIKRAITMVIHYGDTKLYEDAAKVFDNEAWHMCFNIFSSIKKGYFNCINCDRLIKTDQANNKFDGNFFYTWNCFLTIALQYINPQDILNLIIKFSNYIPNDAVDRDFFVKCLLK